MRPLLGIGLTVADRSAPMPIAAVPQSVLGNPNTGIDPVSGHRPDGLDDIDQRDDEKLWLRVPTRSGHRPDSWKGAMRPRRVTYDWYPIESAPFGEDIAVQVTDGRGAPYVIQWPCQRAATGWINSRKGTPLEVTPVAWRQYNSQPRS
jgi:hypothetical protein